MSVALPVITSPVGINRQIVADGEDGFWAETTEQWRENIACLVADATLRQRMGRAGRDKMERLYSLHKAQESLRKLLTETESGVCE